MALTSNYLMTAAERITGLYSDIETEIIADICRRLAVLGELTPTSAWELKKLDELTGISNEVKRKIAEFLNVTVGELEQMFIDGAEYSMAYDNAIYAEAYAEGLISKPPISVLRSPAQMQVLESGLIQTMGELRNITRSTAREATGVFTAALDDIWLQVASGAFTEDVAIKNAVKRLAEKGIGAIEYAKRNDRADVAIRRALTTGLNQTVSKIQLTAADDMGCDLVEVSAHYGARPSHAEWQGKVYSLKGVQGEYDDFYEKTGYGTGPGLCGWNCGHSFYPFFEGLSKPNRTAEELKAMENATVTYNGEEISLYSATQIQRKYERNIRKWKREAVGLEAAGLDNRAELLKVSGWQGKLNELLEQTGLRPQYSRSRVDGYGRSMAGRATQLKKKM